MNSNGKLGAVLVKGPLTSSDTTMPNLAISYTPRSVPGESTDKIAKRATVTVAPTGAVDSKVLITIKVYHETSRGVTAATDTYAISGAASKVSWASGAASASVLTEVIDLINQGLGNLGFKAWVMHARHDQSVDNGLYIALAETNINNGKAPGGDYTYFLNRDVSAFVDADSRYAAIMRVGMPEPRDSNALKLLDVTGLVDSGARLRIYRDGYRLGADEPYVDQATTAAVGFERYERDNAPTFQGSLLVEISNTIALVNCNARVNIMQDTNL